MTISGLKSSLTAIDQRFSGRKAPWLSLIPLALGLSASNASAQSSPWVPPKGDVFCLATANGSPQKEFTPYAYCMQGISKHQAVMVLAPVSIGPVTAGVGLKQTVDLSRLLHQDKKYPLQLTLTPIAVWNVQDRKSTMDGYLYAHFSTTLPKTKTLLASGSLMSATNFSRQFKATPFVLIQQPLGKKWMASYENDARYFEALGLTYYLPEMGRWQFGLSVATNTGFRTAQTPARPLQLSLTIYRKHQ